MSNSHFEGKSVVDHLKEARSKGAIASAEIHGTEMSGHLAAGADSARESAIVALFIWLAFDATLLPLTIFFTGFAVWKIGRSALLGWARLGRLHRLIQEEKWEIEHHRHQEREELREIYAAKGLQGKLLDEVMDVLMADDNRLLHIMLEEELGLTLEAYEHPLKQAVGAGVGVIATAFATLAALWFFPSYGLPTAAGTLLLLSSWYTAKLERNRALEPTIWSLSIAAFAGALIYFIVHLNG